MKALFLATLAIVTLGLISTSHAFTYTLSGLMDPMQATTNPSNIGNGSGAILGSYDDSTMLLDYNISWMDLTTPVTNMHFHVGAVGVPGGVDLGIPSPWVSPEIGTGVLLDANQQGNLLDGNWYVNVHTEMFGGGEIRGQVIVTLIPEPATSCMAAVAFLSMVSLVRRKR